MAVGKDNPLAAAVLPRTNDLFSIFFHPIKKEYFCNAKRTNETTDF